MDDNKAAGYSLPLCRALTESLLVLGVPQVVMVLNLSVAAIFIISLHFLPILAVTFIIHSGAIYLCKRDDKFFDCLLIYLRQTNYYNI